MPLRSEHAENAFQYRSPSRPSAAAMSMSLAGSRGPGGGVYSGSMHSSRGSANGSPIMVGPRGGAYYINKNGNKTYVKK